MNLPPIVREKKQTNSQRIVGLHVVYNPVRGPHVNRAPFSNDVAGSLLSYCNCYGTEKNNELFQHKIYWPHYQNLPFWTPSKSSCNSFLGKECQGVTHVNFWGVQQGGPKRAIYWPQNVLFMCFFLYNGCTFQSMLALEKFS